MHISEGILSPPVLIAGGVVAAAGVVVGLRKIDDERIPRIAVLSSAFFVASLIHVPVGPSNAHLVLNGMMGILLGWAAFPAVLIALLLQAVLFGFGGLTTLGVNTVTMAAPAVACHYLFGWATRLRGRGVAFSSGFITGTIAMALGVLLVCLALRARQEDFLNTLARVGPPLIPAALACGAATGCLAVFVTNAKPGQLPFFGGFNAGAAAIILSVLLVCLALITTGREFANVSAVVGVAHIPIAAVEGVVTGFLAVFLSKVKPELLEVGAAPAGGKESNDA